MQKFAAVNALLRTQVDVPIWWSEWYVEPTRSGWSSERQVALRVAAMIELASSGADTVLYWNPRPDEAEGAVCLWDGHLEEQTVASPCPFSPMFPALRPLVLPYVERQKVYMADGLLRACVRPSTRDCEHHGPGRIRASVDGRQIERLRTETWWVTASRRLEPGPARPRSWSG